MKCFYINNDGGGFADNVDVAEGTTISTFFTKNVGAEANAANYQIRVNRQPVSRDYVLQEGDRISLVPMKIEGAR